MDVNAFLHLTESIIFEILITNQWVKEVRAELEKGTFQFPWIPLIMRSHMRAANHDFVRGSSVNYKFLIHLPTQFWAPTDQKKIDCFPCQNLVFYGLAEGNIYEIIKFSDIEINFLCSIYMLLQKIKMHIHLTLYEVKITHSCGLQGI